MWTYEPELLDDPDDGPLWRVRLRIGDTDAEKPQLQDEEIRNFLDEASGSVSRAALIAAKHLVAKYARAVDKWVGDLKILASQRHRAYLQLVEELQPASGLFGVPSAGGIRISDKDSMEANDDLVVPSFRRGDMDNTGGDL